MAPNDDGKRVGADGRERNTKAIGKKAKKGKGQLSKLDSCDGDEPPLCSACEIRDAVDGGHCQKCIDEGKTADGLEPLPDDDGDDQDEPAQDDEPGEPGIQSVIRLWNGYLEHLRGPWSLALTVF